jgi:hypothetical protein
LVIVEPFELLELPDKASVAFHVVRYELGEMEIHPRYPGAPEAKKVQVLRVHVPPEDKPRFPHYWDVTSKRLIAQLTPVLDDIVAKKMLVRVTAAGVRPAKWYSVEWGP